MGRGDENGGKRVRKRWKTTADAIRNLRTFLLKPPMFASETSDVCARNFRCLRPKLPHFPQIPAELRVKRARRQMGIFSDRRTRCWVPEPFSARLRRVFCGWKGRKSPLPENCTPAFSRCRCRHGGATLPTYLPCVSSLPRFVSNLPPITLPALLLCFPRLPPIPFRPSPPCVSVLSCRNAPAAFRKFPMSGRATVAE